MSLALLSNFCQRSLRLGCVRGISLTMVKTQSSAEQSTKQSQASSTTTSRIKSSTRAGSFSQNHAQRVKRREYRFIFPEFLPDPEPAFRNKLVEKLVRKDLLRRRRVLEIPEFYVGSIVAVTVSDPNSPTANKQSRFLGICIDRGGTGLRAYFILRNVIDSQGVEIMYHLYAPQIVKIEVIKLEKRLDDELYYLRDAPQEYSTFPLDLEPEILPEGVPVPINDVIVPLESNKSWLRRWDVYESLFKGYSFDRKHISRHHNLKRDKYNNFLNPGWAEQVVNYDLMLHYRETIPIEEQDAIWEEVGDELEEMDKAMRKVAAQRSFSSPSKRK